MLFVWLAWAVIGAASGLLAWAARLGPPAHADRWRHSLVGAGSALAGGALGTLIWGSVFATSSALWMAVVSVTLLPRLWAWGRRRHERLAARRGPASAPR